MANEIRQRIELGITDSEGKRGILTLRTDKGYRGGVQSTARVSWSSGDGFESTLIFSDFDKKLADDRSVKATQKAIDTQWKATFTPTVVETIKAEALAFYAKKKAETDAFNDDVANMPGPNKTCIDCKSAIEYLADFPGPRCLKCHEAKVEGEPLEKPDFARAVTVPRFE